ncbi:RNA pyrophosphohydrolase [Candidatus Saccharibacteria bacterium]|nr:MAG: RNA pyrophosphohydrolase [Candidatus Saccharibacteria bacterium]
MHSTTIASPDKDLRRGIDHIGISASFIVHDGKGRVLLQKRGQKARDERGRWDIGGGAIEFGEPIEAAVAREIREELKTEALDVKFLLAYDAFRTLDDKPTHWVALIHTVRVNPNDVAIGEPDKIEALDWFTSDALPDPLHSQFWKSYQVALDRGIVI